MYPEPHLGPVTLQTVGLAVLAAGALVLVRRDRRALAVLGWASWRGFLNLTAYLLYAGTERFLVEFLRRNTRDSLGLTAAQLESLLMVIIGAIWIAIVVQRHGGIGRPAASESGDALQPAL
jgi:prolipoprotein diacylglyceryltransferase